MPNCEFPVATGHKPFNIRSVKRSQKLQLFPLICVICGGFCENVLRLGIVLVPCPSIIQIRVTFGNKLIMISFLNRLFLKCW